MKKVSMAAAALALTTVFSTAAMAKDATLTACTSDGHQATLQIHAEGTVQIMNPSMHGGEGVPVLIPLETLAQSAFAKTASYMTGDELHSQKGVDAFKANLQEAEEGMHPSKGAAVELLGLPTISAQPSCGLRD